MAQHFQVWCDVFAQCFSCSTPKIVCFGSSAGVDRISQIHIFCIKHTWAWFVIHIHRFKVFQFHIGTIENISHSPFLHSLTVRWSDRNFRVMFGEWNQWQARSWFQVFFDFHPYLRKWSNLTDIFQMGCNHHLASLSKSCNGQVAYDDWRRPGKFQFCGHNSR